MSDLTELDLNKLTKDLKEQLKKAKESGIIENKKNKWVKKQTPGDKLRKNLKKFYGTKSWITKKNK